VLQEPLQQRIDDERPRVPDVDARVDRGPAGVDPDPAGIAWLERPLLTGERRRRWVVRMMIRAVNRARAPVPPSVDHWVEDGEIVEGLEAIATPGHTRGHVVFADWAAGLLFAGDHVLPHITPSIGFEPAPPPHPLRDYLESLRLVRQLPDLQLLPAHGPVAASVHDRVDQLLDHHDARLAAVAEALATGPRTGYQVAGTLTWTSRNRPLRDLDMINQVLAVGETVSHLDLLVLRGAVTGRLDGGIRYYGLRVPGPAA
jgi:glyoxylase-like metal-dependent hydrolase (beta-lactamase superfamily II)